MALWSSTPDATTVMGASVVKGSTSEMAPTNVVLPTPKPPAITNLTAVTWLLEVVSESTDTFNHPR